MTADGVAPFGGRPFAGTVIHDQVRGVLDQDLNTCRQTSNMRCTLEGNKIVDHSYVVGASPVGAAPTTSSFST